MLYPGRLFRLLRGIGVLNNIKRQNDSKTTIKNNKLKKQKGKF
jgi:hypothetical protein